MSTLLIWMLDIEGSVFKSMFVLAVGLFWPNSNMQMSFSNKEV